MNSCSINIVEKQANKNLKNSSNNGGTKITPIKKGSERKKQYSSSKNNSVMSNAEKAWSMDEEAKTNQTA